MTDKYRSIMVTADVKASYDRWVSKHLEFFGSKTHKNELKKILDNDYENMCKIESSRHKYKRSNLKNPDYLAIDQINKDFHFAEYEDKSLFKVEVAKIDNIISEILGNIDNRVIRRSRTKIFDALKLQAVRESSKYYAVHITYEKKVSKKENKQINVSKRIEKYIDRINKNEEITHFMVTQNNSTSFVAEFNEEIKKQNIKLIGGVYINSSNESADETLDFINNLEDG